MICSSSRHSPSLPFVCRTIVPQSKIRGSGPMLPYFLSSQITSQNRSRHFCLLPRDYLHVEVQSTLRSASHFQSRALLKHFRSLSLYCSWLSEIDILFRVCLLYNGLISDGWFKKPVVQFHALKTRKMRSVTVKRFLNRDRDSIAMTLEPAVVVYALMILRKRSTVICFCL